MGGGFGWHNHGREIYAMRDGMKRVFFTTLIFLCVVPIVLLGAATQDFKGTLNGLVIPPGLSSDSGTTTFGLDNTDVMGWWTGYGSTAGTKWLRQSDESFAAGGKKIRTGWQFEFRDSDTSTPGTPPYDEVNDRVMTFGIDIRASGADAAGNLTPNVHDIVAIHAEAIANTTGWTPRGVSGITADVVQSGDGVATNEFWVHNYTTAAFGLQAVIAVIAPHVAAWNTGGTTHYYVGVGINNVGEYDGMAAVRVNNSGTGASWTTGIKMDEATILGQGIKMARSVTGSTIEYDDGDYTSYHPTYNVFGWHIANNTIASFSATGMVFGAATGAEQGAGTLNATGLYVNGVAVAGGGLANVVDDTTPQLGGTLDLNGHYLTNTTASADSNYYFNFYGAAGVGKYNVIMASGGTNGAGSFVAQYQASATAFLSMYHNGTDGHITTGAGDLHLEPTGGDVVVGGALSATGGNSSQWNTAYGWGNHASAGYLTSAHTSTYNHGNYDTAYGWGNHASAGYAKTTMTANLELNGYDITINSANSAFIGYHDGVYNTVSADGQDASHAGVFAAFYGASRAKGIAIYHDNADGVVWSDSGYVNLKSATGGIKIEGAVVSYGANDSGGAGYKCLRVPN
jgi:hypothetical protein